VVEEEENVGRTKALTRPRRLLLLLLRVRRAAVLTVATVEEEEERRSRSMVKPASGERNDNAGS
jgi:hypothetical protein